MENNNDRITSENIDNNTSEEVIREDKSIEGEGFVMKSDNGVNHDYVGQNYIVNDNSTSENITGYTENSNFKTQTSDVYGNKHKKKRSGFNKKIFSYVMVGVICTTIGGVASGFASLYVLPKTDFFKNTPFYQQLAGQEKTTGSTLNDFHPTSLAAEQNALTVADIAAKVGPAVVGVSTKTKTANNFFGGSGVSEGMGSGIIINEEGYVLTNYHVVQGAQEVKIIFSNGKEVSAKVINYDQEFDVAVVKITEDVKMPAVAELGDSATLKVGESAVAIGNPLGKDFLGSVTTGVISAVNRKLDEGKISYIQTDAAINQGNSGGPLVNSRGQVIGINTAKIGQSGVEGLGFAIPIDDVKGKITNLSKPVLRVGITAQDITEQLSKQYNFPVGVYIKEIQDFSPAEKAGLKPGDIITKFDGEKIKSVDEINKIKTRHQNGDIVKVEINRDGKVKELELKLTE
jgi:serine protease Do